MIETAITITIFFGLAYLAGLFYPVFFAIIGAPELVPHQVAGKASGKAVIHALKMPDQIFRRYGAWICRKQNEHNRLGDPERIPLSIYKALGLCSVCTSFWLALAVLLPSCFALHLFPPNYFLLLPLAYGAAVFAANSWEV